MTKLEEVLATKTIGKKIVELSLTQQRRNLQSGR